MSPARVLAKSPTLNAVVTLVTSDAYLAGALVAINSLCDAEKPSPTVPFETVCLVTPATVSVETIRALRQSFSLVVGVEGIKTNSTKELNLLGRQDLGYALTKLHLWRLVQFRKVIYLDADVLVLRPISHLFELEVPFAAAPDQGWPDCFNTGVMLCTPDAQVFDAIMDLNARGGSWDGADQGLLNDFFEGNWHRLPFTYNVTPSAYYQFQPAYRKHGKSISVVHFIGVSKPWHRLSRPQEAGTSRKQAAHDYESLLDLWFDCYERHFGNVSTAAVRDVLRPHRATSAFVVPTLEASWDTSSGRSLAYKAPSLDQMQRMFGGAVRALGNALASRDMGEGLYASMPLLGRPDLLSEVQPPKPPSPPSERQPSPPRDDQRGASPPYGSGWDATRGPPPQQDSGAAGEMREGFRETYDNVWDPGHEPGGFFHAPRYAPPPADLKGWYQAEPSDPSAVKAVFPWEQKGGPNRATRVFPSDSPRATSPVARPVSPPDSKAQSQYMNAWDTLSGIRKYADSLNPSSRKQTASPPADPSPSSSSTRRPTSPTATTAAGKAPHHRRTSQDISAHHNSNKAASRRVLNGGTDAEDLSSHDGDDEDEYEAEAGDAVHVKEPRKTRRPSAPQPLPGAARPPVLRPHIRRNQESFGSATRLPILGGLNTLVNADAAVVTDAPAAESPLTPADMKKARDLSTRRTSAIPTSDKAGPTPATQGPREPASRYFDPSTSSDIIRKEGLESLQRFVKSMEQRGEAATKSRP